MQVKTAELLGDALNWAVAKCENELVEILGGNLWRAEYMNGEHPIYHPSDNWGQGGPIIERELYKVTRNMGGTWSAQIKHTVPYYSPTYGHDIGRDDYINSHGNTPLIAAMRCYVASKLGDEIDVPNELIGE